MGLISPGGENLLDFLELRQVLSTYDGDLRDPLWCSQERPVPKRVAWGPLGIPLPSILGRAPFTDGTSHGQVEEVVDDAIPVADENSVCRAQVRLTLQGQVWGSDRQ